MSKKIGRNNPCPCGSGKKYKNCCMEKGILFPRIVTENSSGMYAGVNESREVQAYFKTHNMHDILNFIIGLQLSPTNHGKNVRIEDLARIATRHIHNGGQPFNSQELESILNKEYSSNHLEDLPCNMFSENIAFYGGAYTVFPGISCQSVEILKELINAIFKKDVAIPGSVETRISQGIQCLLILGDVLAKMAGVSGNNKGIEYENPVLEYDRCCIDYSIPIDVFDSLLLEKGINPSLVKPFVLDTADSSLLYADPDHSPLLFHPIVEFDGRYYFLLISNQANAINTFIMNEVLSCNCEDNVANAVHQHIWSEIKFGCTRMEWPMTTYELPPNEDPFFEEIVAQFDTNWIAYVCYVHDLGENMKDAVTGGQCMYHVDDHIKRAIEYLRRNKDTKDYNILTLLLYSSMGETLMIPHNGGENKDFRITFSAFDFIALSQSERWNQLSLLRFAQTIHRQKDGFGPVINMLDIYSIYKAYGESFYMSDDVRYSNIIIPPDDGMHLIFDWKRKRNFQCVDCDKDGKHLYMSVESALEDAPLFKPSPEVHGYYVVTTAFNVPIWVNCRQVTNRYSHKYEVADLFGMAIVFWLSKLAPQLSDKISEQFVSPVFIELSFDEDTFDEYRRGDDFTDKSDNPFSLARNGSTLHVQVHRSALSLMAVGTNEGERFMMKSIISALLDLDEHVLRRVIDEIMPLNSAKMILLTDTWKNEIMDPRFLHRPLYISRSTDQFVLDCLPEYMAEKDLDIDGCIESGEEKKDFLNKLVEVLFEKLDTEVARYRKPILLKCLVDINESLLWDREHDGVIVPAKLLCLADTPEKRESYQEHEKELTNASLAARCLAEYVVSHNGLGGLLYPGREEIEYMMALMRSIVTYGSQSDSLYFGLADVQIEKLKSGRYVITDDLFQEKMEEFARAYIEEDINKHISAFPNRLQLKPVNSQEREQSQEQRNQLVVTADDVNEAFAHDWGISYSDIDAFCYGCYCLCLERHTSSLDIDAPSFVSSILTLQPKLNCDKIGLCINHFSIEPRPLYLKAPDGYRDLDVFPWVYNREFSYIRRFILSYDTESGERRYVLGPRSAMSSLRQLATLLSDGRLQDNTKYLKALRSRFNDIKGQDYNEDVRDYLKKNSALTVWDWEVKIDVDGNLKAEKNYGDIDVLAYDSVRKVLFAIECKKTEKARNVREMKTELDKYFGKPENKKKGYIEKHINRHQWLVNNMAIVADFINEKTDFTIVSIILTSEVIPLSYISRIGSPLPIVAYSQLVAKGIEYLYGIIGVNSAK